MGISNGLESLMCINEQGKIDLVNSYQQLDLEQDLFWGWHLYRNCRHECQLSSETDPARIRIETQDMGIKIEGRLNCQH